LQVNLQNAPKLSLFGKYRFSSCAATFWAGSILIMSVEYPSVSAIETRLSEHGRWESRKLDYRCQGELLHEFSCNLCRGYPGTVLTPIKEETKDCSLSRRYEGCRFSEWEWILVPKCCDCLPDFLLVVQDCIQEK
jgi:hypothetical protein